MNNCVNNVKIEETGVSYRTFSVLCRAGIHTVGEVVQMTDHQLLEIRNLGVKCLEEIKREIFDNERLLKKINKNFSLDTNDICAVKEFSTRTINALSRSGITAISVLKKMTDIQLSKIRNLGAKSIVEIDIVIPDRIRTYGGEIEELEMYRRKRIIETAGRSVLRYIENYHLTISERIERDYRFSGNKKARQVLAEYCDTFPERINEVLEILEAVNDTSDKFYKRLLKLRKS